MKKKILFKILGFNVQNISIENFQTFQSSCYVSKPPDKKFICWKMSKTSYAEISLISDSRRVPQICNAASTASII